LLRHIICVIVAGAMFAGGLYIFWDSIFVAHLGLIRMTAVGAFLAFIGGVWIWTDYGRPLINRLTGAPPLK
jgi:hypothetical protein